MNFTDKKTFINESSNALSGIYDDLSKIDSMSIKSLNPKNTAFVIVDMINGFAKEGPLKSERVLALVPEILKLDKLVDKYGIKKVSFMDSHEENSPEFESYPPHCIRGTSQSRMIDELKGLKDNMLIEKGSTNGFLEDKFQDFLKKSPNITNFILAGDCTDICVLQFALTLKTDFTRQNKSSNVIVPYNLVETFDLGTHNADLFNVFSLYSLIANGIKVVKEITE